MSHHYTKLLIPHQYRYSLQNTRGVYSSVEKKTQPMRPGDDWVYGIWEKMVYVSADKGRKHHKNAKAFPTIVMEKMWALKPV